MFLNNLDKELISTLKGRVSKVLTIRAKLSKEEKSCLENIFHTIDRVILGDQEFDDIEIFRDVLSNYSFGLTKSKKNYIKEHIIPLMDMIVSRKWGTDE